MSELETSGPEDTTCPDRWTLRSGEEWQELIGQPVQLLVRSIIGENANLGFTLKDATELRDQLTQHIEHVTPKPVPKTREEMAAFAKDWDAKVEASRARHV